MGKKVCIVFEETEDKNNFKMYLEGMEVDVSMMTSQEQIFQLSPAEFWGLRMYQICAGIMMDTEDRYKGVNYHSGSA